MEGRTVHKGCLFIANPNNKDDITQFMKDGDPMPKGQVATLVYSEESLPTLGDRPIHFMEDLIERRSRDGHLPLIFNLRSDRIECYHPSHDINGGTHSCDVCRR